MDQGCLSSRSSFWKEKIFFHGRTMSNPRLYEGKGRQKAGDSEEFGGKGKEAIHRLMEGDLSRGQFKNIRGGVAIPCRTEHNDWLVIKKYLSGIKLIPKNSPWTWSDGFQGTSYW